MAVFRIEKTRDYTVMSNHHLRDTNLSLKAKGLLSLMLSLPEGWDYTTKGLAYICKDGVDSICAGVRELEEHGYVIRERIRNANGQLGSTQYTILEQPRPREPEQDTPKQEKPKQENPILEKPRQGNPAQLNIDILNTKKLNKDLSSIDSFPFPFSPSQEEDLQPATPERNRKEAVTPNTVELYREMILENIEYDQLIRNAAIDRGVLDEIVDLILETVCSARKTIRVAGDEYPAELVKAKLLKLTGEHIEFVMDCMRENSTEIRNIKKYLLAVLFNAPSTIESYYTAKVNHDLYSGE